MNRGLVIAGFALLSVVALTGWTRTAGVQPSSNPWMAQPGQTQAVMPGSPVMYVPGLNNPYAPQMGQPYAAYGQPYGYAAAPYGTPVMYAPVPMQPAQPYYAPAPVQPRTQYAYNGRTAPARRVVTTRRYYEPVRTVKRKRPLSHSVAIVAGTSGAGAAIGALAGGGKGAAIGALAGGAGGFLYDRLTANR